MNLLNNMTIKARLILLLSLAGILLITIGLLGFSGMRSGERSIDTIYHDRLIAMDQIGWVMDLLEEDRSQALLALQHDKQNPFHTLHNHPLNFHLDQIEANKLKIEQYWKAYLASKLTPEEKRLTQQFDTAYTALLQQGIAPVITALQQDQMQEANRLLLTQLIPLFKSTNEIAAKLFRLQLDVAQEEYQLAEQTNRSITTTMVLVMVFGMGINLILAIVTIGGIGRGVRQISQNAQQLAAGDLTVRIRYEAQDELAQIATAFNQMGEQFHTMMQQLNTATQQLTATANQSATITQKTNAGILQQQSETDQVATAMNEMSATVQEVANSAAHAAESARRANQESNNGKKVINQTIQAIEHLAKEVERAAGVIHTLEQNSESIGSVLDVIRSIAEQTNLLALNAAIEAARAGEQGRGFAVVADEVRTLASRTQQSTAEIQKMIEQLQSGASKAVEVMELSRREATAGVQQVMQAGQSLDTIAQAVSTINDMNTQIASAAEEQSAVAEEINRNIYNISQVADQTTQGAQQSAAASEQLAGLAKQLKGLIEQFRL